MANSKPNNFYAISAMANKKGENRFSPFIQYYKVDYLY